MRATFSIILIVFTSLQAVSQPDSGLITDTNRADRRYVFWISPSRFTHHYGIMFNVWPRNMGAKQSSYPSIYGVEINTVPFGIFIPFMLAIHSISPDLHKPPAENLDSINFKTFKKIYGLQIGLVNMEPSVINGIDINAAGSFESKVNGVTISGVMNKHYFVNGITIGVIGNHDTKCNGVQAGLINSCRELKGFQVGLWNKNQKRSLPFINWNFKKN